MKSTIFGLLLVGFISLKGQRTIYNFELVSTDNEYVSFNKPMDQTYGINYPVLLDPDMDLMFELGFNSISALLIVNSNNKM